MKRFIAPTLLLLLLGSQACAASLTISGKTAPTTYNNLHLSNLSGPCLVIRDNSAHIIVKASQIGPCGGHGVEITNNTGTIEVLDSYIHVDVQPANCVPISNIGVYVHDNRSVTRVRGSVIARGGQANVYLWNVSNFTLTGNYLLNPLGPMACSNPDNLQGNQFHAWADEATPNDNITVLNNYVVSEPTSRVSDFMGFGLTSDITASGNWINGAGATVNNNACGIILDYKSSVGVVQNNIINETYHCGIGIGDGTGHTVSGNKVLITQGNGNASGISATDYYGHPCSANVSGNTSSAMQSGGWNQGWYADGSCTVTQSNNTFDNGTNGAAYTALYPMTTTNPPPQIPPVPWRCVAYSPYSNATGFPSCNP